MLVFHLSDIAAKEVQPAVFSQQAGGDLRGVLGSQCVLVQIGGDDGLLSADQALVDDGIQGALGEGGVVYAGEKDHQCRGWCEH